MVDSPEENNPEEQILSLKNEFDKLLENLDKEENVKENINIIDYSFLKDDYIELYDRKKLLNDPKYHLAKFKIRYFDFINLNDYFYKTFNKEFVKKDEENEKEEKKGDEVKKDDEDKNEKNKSKKTQKIKNKNSKKNDKKIALKKNSDIYSEDEPKNEIKEDKDKTLKIRIENNLTEKSDTDLKEDTKVHSLQKERNNDIQNRIKKDSKEDSQNDLKENVQKDAKSEKRKEKKENLAKVKKEHSEINLKKDEKNDTKNPTKEVNEKEDSKEENQIMNISANDGDNSDISKDNINISQINDKNKSNEFKNYLNLDDNSSPIIISNNNITISKDSLSENNKITNLSKSNINNSQLQIALTEKGNSIQKEKIHQFQFKFIKRKLGMDDYENISGTAYEEFARKCFKIMLMIITQDDSNFENPKNFSINGFLAYYLNNSINDSLKIKTKIHDIIKQGLIEDIMEIDTVTEFNYKVIEKLIKNFPKNVFFSENAYFENKNMSDEKVTLMIEIAKNIVHQGSEKLSQIIKYTAFISILNLYKEYYKEIIDSKPLSDICKASKISEYTRKMFCIITDGDYSILKYVFIEIIQQIFLKKLDNNDKIKDFIIEKIKANNDFAQKIKEKEMNCIDENIFNVYLMLENLKKNNIKFFVLYIGDVDQCIYQQNLFYNAISNDELKEDINYNKFVKSLQIKKSLPKIKEMNRKLKDIIHSFCIEMDNIANEKLTKLNLEQKIDTLIKKLSFKNFEKIGNELKFDVIFILYQRENNDDDAKIKKKFKDTLEKINLKEFKAIKKTPEIKDIDNSNRFVLNYLQTLNSLINPKLFVIYIMIIDFNDTNDDAIYQIFTFQKRDNYLSYNVRYLIYTKDQNNNIIIDEKKSNFQEILDKKIVNIDDKVSIFLKNFKKNVKYVKTETDKIENLNTINLISKLEDELSSIFYLNDAIPFCEEIKGYDYSISDEQYQKLLFYFSQATELAEINIKLFNQEDTSLKAFLCNKLNNLSENIVCRKIYGLVYYKLFDAIKDNIYNSTKNQFLKLMGLFKSV